jgi:hypothetical protein
LPLQVVEASGPVVDTSDDTEYFCALSLGGGGAGGGETVRRVTSGRRGPSPAWHEAFAFPLRDLLPGEHDPGGGGGARRGMLTVRLLTRKQLRADGAAGVAVGELPLDCLAAALEPGAPPLTQGVLLQACGRPARGSGGAGGGGAGGADALLLRLAAVDAPGAPPGLRGAAGAVLDRGVCASALAAVGPGHGAAGVLYASEGALIEAPLVQHVRLVLHAAAGLGALHHEPGGGGAAAAAASAGGAEGAAGLARSASGGLRALGEAAARRGGAGALLSAGGAWLQEKGRTSRLGNAVADALRQRVGGAAAAGAAEPGAAGAPEQEAPAGAEREAPATGSPRGPGSGDAGGGVDGGEAAAAALGTSPGALPWRLSGEGAAGATHDALGGGDMEGEGDSVDGDGKERAHRRVGSVEREVLMGLLEGERRAAAAGRAGSEQPTRLVLPDRRPAPDRLASLP